MRIIIGEKNKLRITEDCSHGLSIVRYIADAHNGIVPFTFSILRTFIIATMIVQL